MRNWGIRPDAPRGPEREMPRWLLTCLRAARQIDHAPRWLLLGTGLVTWCGALAWAGWGLGAN